MCTPSIPQDNSAQLAQQQAAQRQSQITQGQQNIDQAFGQFNDDYFNNYAKTYENNYNPQVDEQFQRAQRQLNYNETRRGMQDSQDSIYHNDLLNENYGQQRQQVAANATSAENDLRNTVQNQKSQLYALNESAADPSLAASNAAAAAGTIPHTSQYSVLGDLFSGLVGAGSNYVAGQNQTNPYLRSGFSPGGSVPGGSGSGKVVG